MNIIWPERDAIGQMTERITWKEVGSCMPFSETVVKGNADTLLPHHHYRFTAVSMLACVSQNLLKVNAYDVQHFVFVKFLQISKCFLSIPAHDGPIRGVAIDALNQIVVTVGGTGDNGMKFWRFKARTLIGNLNPGASPSGLSLHRDR